jgi:hypothetical protein
MRPVASRRSGRARRFIPALVLFLLASLGLASQVLGQQPNGAGLVIHHGDGRLIYAYVQFDEERISGLDLLTRSGLDVTLAPFGGLGAAVCAVNGEGCPADDCFCHSYGNPAFFWHYYAWQDGAWVEVPLGPASRQLGDGDIDGWSWTSGDAALPATSIDEIALLNGVDRNLTDHTATATLPPEPEPTNTPTAPPPPSPTSTTIVATTPPSPSATATVQVPQATETQPPSPTVARPEPSPTATASQSATATPTPSPTATDSPLASVTPALQPTSAAVLIEPGGTPQPLDTNTDDESGGNQTLLLFSGVVALVALGGGIALFRARRTP